MKNKERLVDLLIRKTIDNKLVWIKSRYYTCNDNGDEFIYTTSNYTTGLTFTVWYIVDRLGKVIECELMQVTNKCDIDIATLDTIPYLLYLHMCIERTINCFNSTDYPTSQTLRDSIYRLNKL